jgi:hypothetical protein
MRIGPHFSSIKEAFQMRSQKIHRGGFLVNFIVGAAIVVISAAIAPSANAATDDACSLLSAAQVSVAASVSVGAGTYVAPTSKKTCVWTPSGDDAKTIASITLLLQPANMYDGGKRLGASKSVVIAPVSGVGDDAYYQVIGTMAVMFVKKGAVSFKVSVYAHAMSVDKKEAIERTLALQITGKL